jgi:hypothetical protein
LVAVIDRHLLAWLGVLGVAFDLFGGLYLAYDLLGGRRGPLRTAVRATTYSLVFGALYTAGVGLPFGPVAGIGLGLLLGLEYGLSPGNETASLVFAVLRGLAFGVAGTLLLNFRFGLVLGAGAAVGLVAAYLARFSVARDYPAEDRRIVRLDVVAAQAVRAAVVVAAAAVAGLVAGQRPSAAVLFAIRLGLTSWVAGSIVGSTTPTVERWTNRLPAHRLGTVGALLLLVGLLIQSLQYWVVILDVRVR